MEKNKNLKKEMKKIENLDELKEIQYNILCYVDNFCRKNKINYWLDCGTLIGAIRHKGFIPWDDDIDIGMLRKDYDKFMKLFNLEGSKYKFYSIENNKKFYYPIGKVLDTSTILFEPDEKGLKLNINIDVFVYDNAPDDEVELNKMFRIRDFNSKMKNIQFFNKSFCKSSFIKEILRYILNKILYFFPKTFFLEKMIKNSKKYNNKQTKKVGNFVGLDKFVCDKDVFNEFIDVSFEGRKFKAPAGYDKWLRSNYKDYMKLPPVEKRVPHHKFVAYKEEN